MVIVDEKWNKKICSSLFYLRPLFKSGPGLRLTELIKISKYRYVKIVIYKSLLSDTG